MLEEAAEPRAARGAALETLEREDLDLYGVVELKERIDRLKAEIARTEAKLDKKQSGRSAADALFKF
jgi:uncharacterized small protein (DUF1192 family)